MTTSNDARSPGVFFSTLSRLGFLPFVRMGQGTLQVVLPEWSYDLAALFFFKLNWLIAVIASRFPAPYAAPDWPLDPGLQPARRPASETSLADLKALIGGRGVQLEDGDVWSLFDSLPAPTTNDMLGNWRGRVVLTGSWLDAAGTFLQSPLNGLGVEWGKRFFSPYKGDPFILILGNTVILPVPLWGNVSMPESNFRGKVGAAMTYDHQPWKDHFRVLDDGTASGRKRVLGNWMSREKNGGWFILEGLPEMDRAVADLMMRSPY